MKNNPFNTILTGVLAASLALSLYYCWLYFVRSKELINIQGEVARYQQTQQFLKSLVSETVEYSRRDPASFGPIFETINLKINRPASVGTTPAKPAAK